MCLFVYVFVCMCVVLCICLYDFVCLYMFVSVCMGLLVFAFFWRYFGKGGAGVTAPQGKGSSYKYDAAMKAQAMARAAAVDAHLAKARDAKAVEMAQAAGTGGPSKMPHVTSTGDVTGGM